MRVYPDRSLYFQFCPIVLAIAAIVACSDFSPAEDSKLSIARAAVQKANDGIPAGLPAGIPVARKTGEVSKIHHDAAIVCAEQPYILVVLVRGVAQEKDSAALIADISRRLYAANQ